MRCNSKISAINRQKIPLLKVDIVGNSGVPNLILPRKIYFSGYLHLITIINTENQLRN